MSVAPVSGILSFTQELNLPAALTMSLSISPRPPVVLDSNPRPRKWTHVEAPPPFTLESNAPFEPGFASVHLEKSATDPKPRIRPMAPPPSPEKLSLAASAPVPATLKRVRSLSFQ